MVCSYSTDPPFRNGGHQIRTRHPWTSTARLGGTDRDDAPLGHGGHRIRTYENIKIGSYECCSTTLAFDVSSTQRLRIASSRNVSIPCSCDVSGTWNSVHKRLYKSPRDTGSLERILCAESLRSTTPSGKSNTCARAFFSYCMRMPRPRRSIVEARKDKKSFFLTCV